MTGGDPGGALTAALAELKRRSGLSYEQLGQKAHLSRSTAHRYCTGRGVPATFAPVEAIAIACRADRDELARLYRQWERAALGRTTAPPPEPPPVAAPRSRHRRTLVALAAVVAVTGLLLGGGGVADPPAERAEPGITAPMWTTAPRAIEPEFVGVTINSNTGQMPAFEVGTVRLWNSRTRWQNLEPKRGQFNWETIERLVTGAEGDDLPVVFVFGGTPDWASPNGAKSVFTDGSRAAPPDDLADWERFVRTVAEKYRGRIGAYELWDMANHPDFFTGSMAELVEMTRLASQAIRKADPEAEVVCPSMGDLWDPAMLDKLREFSQLGGFDLCDRGAVKLSARRDIDPPETMLPLAREIENALHGTGIRMWSTGSAYDINTQPTLDPDRAADHAVRFFLSGLYAGYSRMYFYNWGSAKIPIVLQPAGGPHTKAASHVERLHLWLAGSEIRSCGQGREAGLPDDLWQCRFELGDKEFLIWWTIDQRLEVPAAPGTTSVEDLDGGSTSVEDTLTVTGSPILLRLG
ncbi:helix-turn-helix domain-containing protein [Actinophytocola sp. NPDC049390]|uniref:helix-turn-helix domain-containing protein n=1 Tax=Actinophytocola sp. NPDC049390 TaxID=3363894 RepID=UPI0037A62F8D